MQSIDVLPYKKDDITLSAWLYLIAALTISLAYSCYYPIPTVDDAMISYRYSDRLLHGQGLTWNNGEYVEGYSNLLWVLLVAAGGIFQPNLILVGWVLGLLANAAVLIAIVWAFGRTSVNSVAPVAAGLSVLTLSRSFAFWGTGGLETALLDALLAWALATTYRMLPGRWGWICPALLLGLVSVTRPDGLLFTAGIAVATTILGGVGHLALKRTLRLLIVPFVFVMAQVCFRLYYYGQFVPNTAYAKIAFTPERVWSGSYYVAQGMLDNAIPLMLVVALLILLRRSKSQVIYEAGIFLIPGVLWLVYVGVIGGDIFQFHRHWMPSLICLSFALSSLLTSVRYTERHRLIVVFSIMSTLHIALQRVVDPVFSQPLSKEDRLALEKLDPSILINPLESLRRTMGNCISLGEFLGTAFKTQQPLVAVKTAGCLPYASRLPSLDMFGLNDSYLSHHRPPDMGKGFLAVELGDGSYVLSRKPDLILNSLFANATEPYFRWERQMILTPEFQRNYRQVFFRAGNANGVFWVRVENGRIGIRRTASSIYIPGYLLATTQGVSTELDSDNRLAANLVQGDAIVTNVYFPAGLWDVTLDSDSSSGLQLSSFGSSDAAVEHLGTLPVVSSGTAKSLRVFGGHGLIYGISATRVGP